MPLTRADKKFIKDNLSNTSVDNIAIELGADITEVESYSKKINPQKNAPKDTHSNTSTTFYNLFDFHKIKHFDIYVILGLIILVFVTFANSLPNTFVSDDIATILEDPRIKTWAYVYSAPMSNFHFFVKYIIYSFAQETPWLHRIVNISLHATSASLVYLIFRKLYKGTFISIFVALMYAIHPVISEPVVWISALPYSMYTALFLLSFYMYLLSKNSDRIIFYVISLISFFLALFSTEKAIVLFGIFILYEYIYGSLQNTWKKISAYAVLGVGATIYMITQITMRVDILESNHNLDPGVVNPLLQIPIAITEYLILIFLPIKLTLYHSEMVFSPLEYSIRAIVLLALFGLVIVSGVYARGGVSKLFKFWEERNLSDITVIKFLTQVDFQYIFFWSLFFLVVLSPTLTPFKISWLVAERYIYLAAIGIFALIGLFFNKLLSNKDLRPAIYTLLIIMFVVLGIRTIYRNTNWKNPDTLWISTAKVSPSSPNAHNNLGDVYSRHGDLPSAAKEFARAVELKPNYADAYHNLALTYWNISKVETDDAKRTELQELSRENYINAINHNKNLWQSYQNLGTTYYETGEYETAEKLLTQALQINPNDVRIWLMLAVTQAQMGNKDGAFEIMDRLLSLDPNNPQMLAILAEIENIGLDNGPQQE